MQLHVYPCETSRSVQWLSREKGLNRSGTIIVNQLQVSPQKKVGRCEVGDRRGQERAANVARSCCTGSPNESLFTAEKCEGEANVRFDKDFKTIADVLAQESAKWEIASRCPEIAAHVRGEECAEIGGVCIEIQETENKTAELLTYLMSPEAAEKMSKAAHDDFDIALDEELPSDLPKINPADLGVWIDPIDATAEFIAGVQGLADADHGLPCVTVLIGAYLRSTGEPVMGVINQPFYNDGKGRIAWGVNYGNTKRWSGCVGSSEPGNRTILMSSAEQPEVAEKFKNIGWEVKSAPGAGNKLLKVVLGEAAAYILSKGTTFRWDTCAPHAILRATGGDLVCYSTHSPITYNDPEDVDTQQYSNSNGIIAYRDHSVFDEIKSIIC